MERDIFNEVQALLRNLLCGPFFKAERNKFFRNLNVPEALKLLCNFLRCGRYRIRTCEGLLPLVFETSAFSHSANLPHLLYHLSSGSKYAEEFYGKIRPWKR